MSAALVDTHAALWFLDDAPELSAGAKEYMETAEHTLYLSAASVWEIAIKRRIGKLDVPEDLLDVLLDEGFEPLPVTWAHAWGASKLPLEAHRDPFDRLLVSQSLLEDVPIISGDEALDQYGVARRW